jgi:hypothetical protein
MSGVERSGLGYGWRGAARPGMTWAAASLLAAAAVAGVAHACSCVPPGSASRQLANADLMIVARVSETRRLPPIDGSSMAETRFSVSETIKGPVRRYWVIRHQRGDSALCGAHFRPGKDYAFLARFADGKVWTSSCERAWFPLSDYRAAYAEPGQSRTS